jgi:hypothetical protein
MYSIILCAVLGLLIIGIKNRSFGAAAFGGIVGAIVGIFVSLFVSMATPHAWVEEGKWDLAAMRTTDHVHGAFVLGSGSFEGTSSYRVLIRNADGSMTPFSVAADNRVKIFEDAGLDQKGVLIIHMRVADPKSALYNWGLIHATQHRSYELHVPKGSVVTQFSVQP